MRSHAWSQKWHYWVTALPMETRAVWHFWGKGRQMNRQRDMRLFQLNEKWLLAEVGVGVTDIGILQRWWELYPPQTIWNIGISGALVPDWQVGEWAVITSVCNEATQCLRLQPAILPGVRSAMQVTVSEPVLDSSRGKALFQKTGASLVDMELFNIVRLSRQLGEVPVSSIRVVSDYADEQAIAFIQHHLSQLQQSLRQVVQQLRITLQK